MREEVLAQVLALVVVDVVPALDAHVGVAGEARAEGVCPGLAEGGVHLQGAVADERELLAGRAPVGRERGHARGELPLEAADALAEEFVEVRGGDAEVAHALHQRHALVEGLREDAPVEVEPRELAVEVQARVAVRRTLRHLRRARRVRHRRRHEPPRIARPRRRRGRGWRDDGRLGPVAVGVVVGGGGGGVGGGGHRGRDVGDGHRRVRHFQDALPRPKGPRGSGLRHRPSCGTALLRHRPSCFRAPHALRSGPASQVGEVARRAGGGTCPAAAPGGRAPYPARNSPAAIRRRRSSRPMWRRCAASTAPESTRRAWSRRLVSMASSMRASLRSVIELAAVS